MPTVASFLTLLLALSGSETTQEAVRRAPLPRLDSTVSSLAPDGRRLAIAAPPDRVLVLDLPSGEIEATIDTSPERAVVVAWRSDGFRLAVLDGRARVTVVDTQSYLTLTRKLCAEEMPGNPGDLRALQYGGTSNRVVAGFPTHLEMFEGDSGHQLARIEPKDVDLSAMALSRDGSLVALGDRHGHVGVWSTSSGERICEPIQLPVGSKLLGIHALDFNPDSRSVAIGTGDARARIWRFADAEPIREFSHEATNHFGGLAIGDVQFSPDGARLVATSFSWSEIRIWDVASGRLLGSYDFGGGGPVRRSSSFTADGRFVVAELGGVVLDAKDGALLRQIEPKAPGWARVRHRSESALVWTSRNGKLRVCEVESGLVVLERATE